jgi:DegV family protein with EDD domain
MALVRIVTDSAADLDAETVQRLQISVVPLTVLFGSKAYLHSELSNDEFWDRMARGAQVGTSQPALGLFEEVYSRLTEAGHSVLCVTLTAGHSGTFSTALMAAQGYGDQVRVVDSQSLSLGQGFQVLAAARAALDGLSLDRVARVVEQVKERSHLLILLDTIENVRRGGRADSLIPILDRVTKVLHIKPILDVVDGHLGLRKLTRSYERGLGYIQREMVRLAPLEHLAVMHTRCVDMARRVAHTLSEQLGFPRAEIVVAETGPALAVHGGPRVIGVAAVQREV